jgi:hypothetical protein
LGWLSSRQLIGISTGDAVSVIEAENGLITENYAECDPSNLCLFCYTLVEFKYDKQSHNTGEDL